MLRSEMDHFEQPVLLEFLFLKGLRYKAAHIESSSVLGEQLYSLSQAKQWISRFKDGDLSFENDDRSGRPFSDLFDGICRHLGKLPFTSAKVLAKPFRTSLATISRILKNAPGTPKILQKRGPS
jgi:hypothetical protein